MMDAVIGAFLAAIVIGTATLVGRSLDRHSAPAPARGPRNHDAAKHDAAMPEEVYGDF